VRDGKGSAAGKNLLRGCIQTLSDNKGVEELHHHCKSDAKNNACTKQSSSHIQHVIMTSGVLERKGLKHSAAIKQEDFRRNFKLKSRLTYSRKHHSAQHHKLPQKWSRIMGPKRWRTTTEAESRIGASAWHWLQTIVPSTTIGCRPRLHELSPGIGIGLARALFSRLLLPRMLFMWRPNNSHWATLSRGKWGAIVWPMVPQICNDTLHLQFACDRNACAQWHHVLALDDYDVIPYCEALLPYGISLQKSGNSEPLAKAALRKCGSLSCDDLARLARHYALIENVTPGRKRLLELLANHVGGYDADFIDLVLKDLPPECGISMLAQDPFFEFAFDELELDNRQELGDIKKALDRQKSRNHTVARSQKRRAEAKVRAKAKAVAKAKVAPAPAGPPVIEPLVAPVDPALAGPPPVVAPPAAPVAYGRGYEYIAFAGGHIVFSDSFFKINAHCLHAEHQTNKCHLDLCKTPLMEESCNIKFD